MIVYLIIFFINVFVLVKVVNIDTIKEKKYDDYLFHMSSETETIFRALNNIFLYDKNFTFISINQIDNKDSYDSGIVKYDMTDITSHNESLTNNKLHYIQGFTEIKEAEAYMAHKYSVLIDKPVKLKGVNANYAIILKFKRLIDSKIFYYIQMTQTFGGYFNDNSYRAISELLQYIIQEYPGEYIITGDFNVHGHEKIFKHFLTEEKYHICPFYKYITCNDGEGLASPDGIVVSKNLYNHVQYNIDIYPGQSYQHYMITAKLYINGPIKTESIIDKKTLLYFEQIQKKNKKKNYVNNEGLFDIEKHLGYVTHITPMPFRTKSNIIYRNAVMADKLNKISLK